MKKQRVSQEEWHALCAKQRSLCCSFEMKPSVCMVVVDVGEWNSNTFSLTRHGMTCQGSKHLGFFRVVRIFLTICSVCLGGYVIAVIIDLWPNLLRIYMYVAADIAICRITNCQIMMQRVCNILRYYNAIRLYNRSKTIQHAGFFKVQNWQLCIFLFWWCVLFFLTYKFWHIISIGRSKTDPSNACSQQAQRIST